MNAYWVASSAYNQNGTHRDAAHSTLWNRKALARITVILRGGTQGVMNAKLAQLGLPHVRGDLPVTTPKLRIVWNPQGFDAQFVRDMAKWVRQHRRDGVHRLLRRSARVDLGPRHEAALACCLPHADHAARHAAVIGWDDLVAVARELPSSRSRRRTDAPH
jgi:hypothetical protein